MTRFPLSLDPETRARLRARAKAHKVTQAAFLRSLINGHRPGAEPGSEAAAADAWWDSRTPARRISIYRNHCARADGTNDLEHGQLSIFDGGNDRDEHANG